MTSITLVDILREQPGCVLGDEHDDTGITAYITRQMPALAQAGVKAMFVEMFQDTEKQRALLEAFNRDTHGQLAHEEMRKVIESGWKYPPKPGFPPRGTADYLKMLEAARENGIAVIGMDPPQRDSFRPIKSANQHWERCVRDYMSHHPHHKFVVFGGALHTEEANQLSEECDQATGVDKLLNIPCVTFGRLPYTDTTEPRIATINGLHYKVILPKSQELASASPTDVGRRSI